MKYYLNLSVQPEGENEMHAAGCRWIPSESNAIFLGQFTNCREAIAHARVLYPFLDMNGCAYCVPGCNTD